MNQRVIFKKTLDWVQDRIDKDILNSTSADLLQEAMGTLRAEIDKHFQKNRKESVIFNYLNKNGYMAYLKHDFKKNNKGLSTYSLKDLRPKFKKQLDQRVQNSFNWIKNKDDELKQKLASKFMSWVTIDSEDTRGSTTSKQSLLNFLDFAKENDIAEEHALFVLRDQASKMRASFDMIVAEENGAIGGVWINRGDKRVVGNPDGLYPYGNKAHNDHWDRGGKFFIFKNSWAYQKGFVKGEKYEDLEDGGVGVAINCRCRLEMIYDLRDVPIENLTKKGKELINV